MLPPSLSFLYSCLKRLLCFFGISLQTPPSVNEKDMQVINVPVDGIFIGNRRRGRINSSVLIFTAKKYEF